LEIGEWIPPSAKALALAKPAKAAEIAPWLPVRLTQPSAVAAARKIADKQLVSICRDWTGKRSVLITGPSKIGKSLAAAMAGVRLARDHGSKMHWFRADELARALADRGGSERVELAKGAPLICLDELGWERFHETLCEVVGARYDRGLVAITTTGLPLPELVARYGDAFVRRLTDPGGILIDLWANRA
jgi:DNA replication protein DnaC